MVGVIRVGRITGEFNLIDLFKEKTVPVNTRHNLVESILSNTESPIGVIEKAQVHLHMGVYN